MENNTNNKKVIIIGASSGIGLSTALLLSQKGYDVINISRSNLDATLKTVPADASVPGSLRTSIDEAAAGNPIDALIYSAGCSMASPIEYAEPADYRYLFEVNFFGILEAMRAAIPHMKTRGGRIILISSMGGTLPVAFDAFYSASKAAVDMIAEAADLELKPYNIRVCAVRPGGVATQFTFKRNIYPSGLVHEYAGKQNKATAALAEMEQGGMPAEKVARTVAAVLETPNPPTKLAVGFKGKVFDAAVKILPLRVVEFFNSGMYDQ